MPRATALILMVVAPVLWSTAGVVTRHIERALPFEQVFWRSLFAFLFVFAVLGFKGKGDVIGAVKAAGRPGLLSGALWALMFSAFVIALSLTSTANALVVMSIAPLLTALLAWIVLKEAVPVRTWIAAGVATIGIAWMAASGFSAHGTRDVAGMLVALTVSMAAATNFVTLRAVARNRQVPVDLAPAVMLGGLLSCLIALPLALPFSASGRDLAVLALLGIFQLGLPCMLLVIASRSLLAPEISLLALLEVVLGPLWAWLGAGEVPESATLVGGAMVLAALAGNELAALRGRAATASR